MHVVVGDGALQAPFDRTDAPLANATDELAYVIPSQPHTGAKSPTSGGLGLHVPLPHAVASQYSVAPH